MIAAGLVAVALAAQAAGDPACPADTTPAMSLVGVPAVAVTGQSYELALVPSGPDVAVARNGSTLGVHDASGVGWDAHFGILTARQSFSVGLNGPFTVTGSYSEQLGSGTCTRTLTVPLPIERRIYAIVGCGSRRGIEPARLVLRCGWSRRLRLSGLHWTGWNSDRAVARGKVVLSHPRECTNISAFIYTRARVPGVKQLIPIACPIV
jgi:hypothetical protein